MFAPLPTVQDGFQVILVDAPWLHYGSGTKDQAAAKHYDCVDTETLKKLPVGDIAAKRSVIFMWTTGTFMPDAIDLMREWGFFYRNVGFVWCKTSKKTGNVIGGQGARPSVVKQMTEYVLVGSTVPKGRPLPLRDEGVHQVLEEPEIEETCYAPRPENVHSRKPVEIRQRIEQLFLPDVRRVELFARQQVEGWTGWGNQL